MLHRFQLEGLQRAAAMNSDVKLSRYNKPTVLMPTGKPRPIVPSLTHVQLYWGASHCLPGKQHYRYCTPHTLRAAIKLRCSFCAYNACKWVAEGGSVIPLSEQWVMWQLGQLGLDEQFCWQAEPGWWRAPVDFMMVDRRLIIQADGSSHFKAMHGDKPGKQQQDDLRFCETAVGKGVSVVRIHAEQCSGGGRPQYLAAAIQLAAASTCVVLSPGYNTVAWYEKGSLHTIAQMLADRLSGFRVCTAAFGNIVISKQ